MSTIPQSVITKLERANHHISDLKSAVSKFLNSGPYKTVGYIDSDGRPTYCVANVSPIDHIIPVIVGDAIQNLRAALDYISCSLWSRTNSGECKRVYFPVASASDYKTKGLGKIKGMGQDAIDAISA